MEKELEKEKLGTECNRQEFALDKMKELEESETMEKGLEEEKLSLEELKESETIKKLAALLKKNKVKENKQVKREGSVKLADVPIEKSTYGMIQIEFT